MNHPVSREEVEEIVTNAKVGMREEIEEIVTSAKVELREEIRSFDEASRQRDEELRGEMNQNFMELKADLRAVKEAASVRHDEIVDLLKRRDREYTGYFSDLYTRVEQVEVDITDLKEGRRS